MPWFISVLRADLESQIYDVIFKLVLRGAWCLCMFWVLLLNRLLGLVTSVWQWSLSRTLWRWRGPSLSRAGSQTAGGYLKLLSQLPTLSYWLITSPCFTTTVSVTQWDVNALMFCWNTLSKKIYMFSIIKAENVFNSSVLSDYVTKFGICASWHTSWLGQQTKPTQWHENMFTFKSSQIKGLQFHKMPWIGRTFSSLLLNQYITTIYLFDNVWWHHVQNSFVK